VTFPNGSDLSSKIPKLPHEEVNLSAYKGPGIWGSVSKQEWKDCNKYAGSLVAIDFAVVPIHLVTRVCAVGDEY
jgi:hypothetical protein